MMDWIRTADEANRDVVIDILDVWQDAHDALDPETGGVILAVLGMLRAAEQP